MCCNCQSTSNAYFDQLPKEVPFSDSFLKTRGTDASFSDITILARYLVLRGGMQLKDALWNVHQHFEYDDVHTLKNVVEWIDRNWSH